jgi:hypothetical protein
LPLGIRWHLHQRCDQAQQCLLFRPIPTAQELAQLNVGQSTTRRGVGLVNDESMTAGRLAPEEPCIAVRAAIEFSPVSHGSLRWSNIQELKCWSEARSRSLRNRPDHVRASIHHMIRLRLRIAYRSFLFSRLPPKTKPETSWTAILTPGSSAPLRIRPMACVASLGVGRGPQLQVPYLP